MYTAIPIIGLVGAGGAYMKLVLMLAGSKISSRSRWYRLWILMCLLLGVAAASAVMLIYRFL